MLGIDPGSVRSAWALVDVAPDGRPTFLRGGFVPSMQSDVGRLLTGDHDLVAIECIVVAFHVSHGMQALLETSGVQRATEWLAIERGIRTHGIAARAWRKVLCDKPDASNHAVKIAVEDVCGPLATNEHVRDAIGTAVVSAWEILGARAPLSEAGARALEAQNAEDGSKRAKKSAATRAKNKAAKDAAAQAAAGGGTRP